MTERKIIIMNGRGNGRGESLYVGAYSKADASRLLSEVYPYTSPSQWMREINVYWSVGCWGRAMDGIEPERGVWIQRGFGKQVERIEGEKTL